MIVLLVGPSGVGKSSTYEVVQHRFPGWIFRDLDGLAAEYALRQGWIETPDVTVLAAFAKNRDHFLAIGLQAIADLAARNEGRPLVVDVGAGFQDAAYATRLPLQYPAIALVASPEVAFRRIKARPGERRSEAEYTGVEFSLARRTLYGRSRETIDTTSLTRDEAAEQLAAALRRIIG